MSFNATFMQRALEIAEAGVNSNDGGPFGAVVVLDGKIVGEGWNRVTSTNDPTAHAEVVAIRDACKNLNSFQLEGCEIYATCEPCPMCLGAIYWARPKALYFACNRKDAAHVGFDDDFIYQELILPFEERGIETSTHMREEGLRILKAWNEKTDKVEY